MCGMTGGGGGAVRSEGGQALSDRLGTGSLCPFRALKVAGTPTVGFKLSHRVLLVLPLLLFPTWGTAALPFLPLSFGLLPHNRPFPFSLC